MIIKILMDNNADRWGLTPEHGFSAYIETSHHKVLVDTGASPKTWENAKSLAVDISQVDTLILSHGHYDHSGGIIDFAKQNPDAKIYINHNADGDYYSTKTGQSEYIGIDKAIAKLPQCIKLGGACQGGLDKRLGSDHVTGDTQHLGGDLFSVDDEISVFGNVTGRRKWPQSNLLLKKKNAAGEFVQDDFDHEQYVVIQDGGKRVLISGCAHNGILNILDKYRQLFGGDPDLVISGFHMMKHSDYTEEETELIREIARELSQMDTHFYTGHCTGDAAFNLMKPLLGEQLHYFTDITI